MSSFRFDFFCRDLLWARQRDWQTAIDFNSSCVYENGDPQGNKRRLTYLLPAKYS